MAGSQVTKATRAAFYPYRASEAQLPAIAKKYGVRVRTLRRALSHTERWQVKLAVCTDMLAMREKQEAVVRAGEASCMIYLQQRSALRDLLRSDGIELGPVLGSTPAGEE